MPRPKVKPQDRQRSAKACLPCKASKIRCDAGTPCGPCSKRERANACIYLESSRREGPRKRQKLTHFPTPSLENATPQFGASLNDSNRAGAVEDAQLDIDPTLSSTVTATANTTPTPEPGNSYSRQTESRMLFSSKGEKLYVGENASLSFLQFLRQVLKKYMGPSAFTENHFRDSMLEMDVGRDDAPVNVDQSREDKYALVQLYREASSGIIDLYTLEEIHTYLDRHNILSPGNVIAEEDKHARAEQASLNIMLAIGSQCRAQNPFDSFNAARSFTCAQKFAFEGFLCDPSLDMVRIFLLMAFYMLGACHRNAAFMYLGIASKAACALGLHRKGQVQGLTKQECLQRWRTWKSLLILDTIVSSILGRPGGLPPMRPNEDPSCDDDDEGIDELDRPRWLASRAVFQISSRIIELEQQIGNGKSVDSANAEGFLKRLRDWNSTLPPELRHFAGVKEAALGPPDREMFIGATHVACTYYFTIILVTRPFLISHLVSQIRRRRRPSIERSDSSHISDLAQACLDSAMFMSKLGFVAINSMILSNNMCLLKAWMFAAGLLLGFSMFAQSEPIPEIDEAFQNAITVLERLAQFSPQARLYFEILTTFSDAIRTRREQLGKERRKKSGRYVSQIFTADFHNETLAPSAHSTSAASESSQGAVERGAAADVDLNSMMNFDFDASSYDLSAFPHSTDEWSDMPLLSDNLYIDWESVWPVSE